MRFAVLGPVAVSGENGPVELPGRMPRSLLAVLLLNAGAVVPVDRLIEALWGEHPPASASAALYNHVMRLRRALDDADGERVRAVAPGYLLRVEQGELDLHSFAALCASGRAAARAGRWQQASSELSAALGLWRGAPFADEPGLFADDRRVQKLLEERLLAFEDRIEADLELGRHREVIADLRSLAAENPLRESLHGQLMLALYRAGRQAEALEAYAALRGSLVGELGLEPSPELSGLQRRILSADPELAAPEPAFASLDADRGARLSTRFQLPADTRVFTGRAEELDRLETLVGSHAARTAAGMVAISAIDGMAGIGKTALAVHAAHRMRGKFPDGQLFVDLQGYTPGRDPMGAADALDYFLRALGLPPELVPPGLAARSTQYRERLEGTRTLVVLDNAASAAQVRALVPDSPDCLVLVTSRRRLAGLEGADWLALDTLPEPDALALLHRVAGAGRIPEHHPAAAELVALCGRMPLALRIMGAQLRRHRTLRIADLAARLRDEQTRLNRIAEQDRDLTAVFDLSYAALPVAEQQLLALLGQVPGPDFDAYAAACLVSTDHRTAEHLLESLLDHNLLIQHAVDRYRFHDLLRIYAATRGAEQPAAERRAALDRLLDHYERTAWDADRRFNRRSRPGTTTSAEPSGPGPVLPDRDAALAWMRAEHDSMRAAVADADARAEAPRTTALTAALAGFLQLEHLGPQTADLHRAAAAAARELGDTTAEANALWDLGRILNALSENPQAAAALETALALYSASGDRRGEANVLYDLGYGRYLTADLTGAIALAERAVDLCGELGDSLGQADALTLLAYSHVQNEDPAAAADLLARAYPLYQAAQDGLGQANALFGLGNLRNLTGDLPAAGPPVEQALGIFQSLGNRLGEANALTLLGSLELHAGQVPTAVGRFEQAIVIYRDLGFRYGESNVILDLGRAGRLTGDYPAATALLRQALDQFQRSGDRAGEANALLEIGCVRCSTGELPAAREALEQSLALARETGSLQGQAVARLHLGRVHQAAEDLPGAAEHLDSALEAMRRFGDRQGEAATLNAKGALAAATSGPAEALTLYQEALRLARECHSPLDEARSLEGIARATTRTGDRTTALHTLRDAIALYERIGAAETATATAFLAELDE